MHLRRKVLASMHGNQGIVAGVTVSLLAVEANKSPYACGCLLLL